MNRQDFMNRLAAELSKLPKEEVQAAMDYYSEYLDEAGVENEAAAIKELGNPARIATQIKADYAVKQLDGNNGKQSAGKGLRVALWIILGVFAAPVALPIAIALGAVALACFITLLAVMVALLIGFGAICLCGIGMVIVGIVGLFANAAAGIMLIGIGLVFTGLMALLCVGVFIGGRALIHLIARQMRKSSEVHRMKRLVKEERNYD